MPSIRKISDIKPLFTNLAQTSHYQLIFGGLPGELQNYLLKRGVSPFFVAESAGLLCYNASLPTSNLATKTVDGNFTGISENFAVGRTYGEITLDFYVDSDYLMIKFLESWMEFISSGSHNPIGNEFAGPVSQGNANYFVRMQYPETYKTSFTKIIKFDRNYEYFKQIEYTFVGLWPVSMSPPVVSYIQSDVLKIAATFKYDRYIAGRALSLNRSIGDDNNKSVTTPNIPSDNPRVTYRTGSYLGESGVRPTITNPGNVFPTVLNN
jgi:hypothetical protein